MSEFQHIAGSKNFGGRFRQEPKLNSTLMDRNLLSRGIRESELADLLERGVLPVQTNGKANASVLTKSSFGEGLKISWTYGSSNDNYLSIIIFKQNNIDLQRGHSKQFLGNTDSIALPHKLQENPYVCRINGEINIDDVHYVLVRDNMKTTIYAQGVDTIAGIQKILHKGDENNTIFGEYHFIPEEITLENKIIEAKRPDVIYSEMLGYNTIENMQDVDKLSKFARFQPKKNIVKHGITLNFSQKYLLDWFYDHKIPIIGLHDVTIEDIAKKTQIKNNSLSLVGRKHLGGVYNQFDDAAIYASNKNNKFLNNI